MKTLLFATIIISFAIGLIFLENEAPQTTKTKISIPVNEPKSADLSDPVLNTSTQIHPIQKKLANSNAKTLKGSTSKGPTETNQILFTTGDFVWSEDEVRSLQVSTLQSAIYNR